MGISGVSLMSEKRFEDFMNRTEDDLKYIRDKVDTLWDFRILMIGGSIVVSTLISAGFSIAFIYFGVH
jgi:hypothetical protein